MRLYSSIKGTPSFLAAPSTQEAGDGFAGAIVELYLLIALAGLPADGELHGGEFMEILAELKISLHPSPFRSNP